jgi:hypothetical protein
MRDEPGYRTAPIPAEGALRVHPDPSHLPRLRSEPGRNRFDDPERAFSVRYAAATLRGCLIETMARFRPDPVTEAALADVDGIEAGDVEHPDPAVGLEDWLAAQKVALLHPYQCEPVLLDVEDADLLVLLNKHPLVRGALDRSGLGTRLSPVHLDAGIVRLGGPLGRPITQAMARAAKDWLGCDGLAYRSRLDPDERCWALWEDTSVNFTTFELSPVIDEHRAAVQSVARTFEILLPDSWA